MLKTHHIFKRLETLKKTMVTKIKTIMITVMAMIMMNMKNILGSKDSFGKGRGGSYCT